MSACPSCGAENPGGARFCATCGSSLMATCTACGADLPDGARFCAACGTPVVTQAPGGEERKLVTILFADVTGSTQLGEQLDPERLREVMDRFFRAMREEIEAEGGTVEKFIGDAVMAAFGVPTAHEDDPARALRAAMRMLDRLETVNDDLASSHGVTLQIRIGVNTGDVLATTSPKPGEAMVTGDAVNAASRLQSAAEPGTILASERTARAVRGFAFSELGALELKGKAEPVVAFRVSGETPVGQERGVPGLRAPMVGRDAEIELLQSIYLRTVRERRPNLVTIYGDAGVGKSRLTREFLAWTEALDPPSLQLSGRCLPYGDGITYWPLAEILKGHAGVLDSDSPELAVEKVRKLGRELLTTDIASDPVRATAALAYTVGLEDPDVSFAGAEPREVRDEVHAAWRSFFTAVAAGQPTVVLIEDIHWADPVLLDLLEELADRVDGPTLFLCPSRPDLTARRPGWGGGRRNTSSIALDPLTPDDAQRLIRLLLTIDELPPSVHLRILERAEGNPFFLEEIVRRLIDGGQLLRSGERWQAQRGIEDVDIPDTVQAVLASRIDLLDPSDKRVLQAAAVVGRLFWTGPVADLTGMEQIALADALRRLEERELVLSRAGSSLAGEPEFIFKHILTRDVAYESLPKRERAAAHTSTARWIERTAGERVAEFSELLAYHLSTAVALAVEAGEMPDDGIREGAYRWLLRASMDASRRLVLRKAERLAESALELAAGDLERVDALERMGQALIDRYTGDLAWKYFREAALLRADTDPPDDRRVAYLAARAVDVPIRWPGSMRAQIPTEADVRSILDLGLQHLPGGDSEERVRLLGAQAGWPFAFPMREYTTEELDMFESGGIEAAEIALRLERHSLASGALDNAAAAWASQGDYRRSIPLWERRARVIELVSDPLEIGDFFAMGVWSHYEVGGYERAADIADEGIVTLQNRAPNVEIHLRSWWVATLARLGRWDDALSQFDVTRELLDDRRDDPPYFASHAFAVAATIRTRRGEGTESDRLIEQVRSFSSGRLYPFLMRLLVVRGEAEEATELELPRNWRVHAGDVYESRAEIVAALEKWEDAPALLSEMRSHAETSGCLSVVSFADRLEGRAAIASGNPVDAGRLLSKAADGFEALGATWERALTDLDLAGALHDGGNESGTEAILARAEATFIELGDLPGLAAARAASSSS